jgi:hypothetical protein
MDNPAQLHSKRVFHQPVYLVCDTLRIVRKQSDCKSNRGVTVRVVRFAIQVFPHNNSQQNESSRVSFGFLLNFKTDELSKELQ